MQLYWANINSLVIHKDPSSEACNRDDATKKRIRLGLAEVDMILRKMGNWRLCERCFTDEEQAKMLEAASVWH